MNVATIFERSARQFPERVALRRADEEMTYEQLEGRANALAGFLRENGLKSGDRVAIFLPNRLEYIVSMLATWKAGGVALPMNFMFSDEDLRYVLDDSESSWLVVREEDLERVGAILPEGAGLEDRLIVTGHGNSGYPFVEIVRHGEEEYPTTAKRDGEDAILMYTSGTTGRPKGVRQTHRNNSAAIDMVADAWKIDQEDHFLLAVPLFHVGGLQCSTFPLLACGGTVSMLPSWSAKGWLDAAVSLEPTLSGLVATMVVDIVNHVGSDTYDLGHVRLCFIGGSRTPEPIVRRFEQQLGISLRELYGQTENTGLSVTYRADEERLPGSMGKAMEQVVEARVAHPQTGEDIPQGDETVGELHLRGDTISPGYWGLPEKTAEKFVDGWIRTGDMVCRSESRHLYYADRIDDMIVSGGENVYPQEVESALAEHEGVAEVAVIGTPHERWVEQVTAIVVSQDGTVTAEGIAEFCAGHSALAGYRGPRRIEFVEELPKTGSGKINKAVLKEQYGKGGER